MFICYVEKIIKNNMKEKIFKLKSRDYKKEYKRLARIRYSKNIHIIMNDTGAPKYFYDHIKIYNEKDHNKRMNLIYDYLYDYLKRDMEEHNYCDFKDGKCIANRLGKSVHDTSGCCYFHNHGLCKYMYNNKCHLENLSCKVFMCEYLAKKGIDYTVDTMPFLKTFCTIREQNHFLRTYHTPKKEFMKTLKKYYLISK